MNKIKDIKKMLPLLGHANKRYFAAVFGYALMLAFGNLMLTFSTGQAVNIVEKQKWGDIYRLCFMLVFTYLLWILSCLFRKVYENCMNLAMAQMRDNIYRKIGRLPMAYFDRHLSGDLISRTTNDISSFSPLAMEHIPDIVFILVLGVVSITSAMIMNWKLCVLFVACSLGFKFINDRLSEQIRQMSGSVYSQNSMLVQKLLAVVTGIPVIKLFGLQESMRKEYLEENNSYTQKAIRLEFWKALQNATNALMTSTVADLAVIIGAWMVLRGDISLAALLVVSQLSGAVTMVFRWLGQLLAASVSSVVAGERILELLHEKEETKNFPCIAPAKEKDKEVAIAFENVSFSYGEKEILRNVSFGVKRGETLAITGKSGGGKSTVLKLILGFYDCQAGQIYVDGKPQYLYSREELRAMVSYVSQDPFLFNATILDNIRCGKEEADEERVKEAARMADAHEFISGLPLGYETIVGERAVRLSGGQKQRIALARAILKNAPILLLDEATSAMDANTQEQVQEAMGRLMKEKTTIVVAHRPSTLRKADRIMVLRDGEMCGGL